MENIMEKNKDSLQLVKEQYPEIYKSYKVIMNEQFKLFCDKHLDYGMSNISAGTQLESREEIDFALTGLWYRMSDKISRWKNLIIKKRQAQNEPLIDTYQDIVNYAIIAQMVEKGEWKK
tara:strand:- start:92 stop:448 length:357 start_codon:yes stop_codon:yes gene_type:complete